MFVVRLNIYALFSFKNGYIFKYKILQGNKAVYFGSCMGSMLIYYC